MEQIINGWIHYGLDAAATALAGLIVAIALQLFQKLHLQLSATREAQLRYYVRQAIQKAEEVIEAQADKYAAQGIAKGNVKLSMAINTLIAKVPGLDANKASELIHEELGGMPGVGASGKIVAAVASLIPGAPAVPQSAPASQQ